MRTSAAVLAAAILAGCAGERWQKVDLTSLPRADQYPDTKVLVLLEEVTATYFADPETGAPMFDETRHRRSRILHPTEVLDSLRIYHDRTFALLQDVRARVVLPDGTQREYTRADGRDFPAVGGSVLFSDDRVLEISLGSPPVGSVVEWFYTLRRTSGQLLSTGLSFQGDHPVREARLTVETPRDWEVEATSRGSGVPAPQRSAQGDVVRRTWQMENQVALPDEPLEGLWYPPQVIVRLASWSENGVARQAFRSARDLSAHVAGIYGKDPPLEPEMKALVTRVTTETSDPTERSRKLYEWVRDEITYCAVEVGWGGWKPIPAAEVFRGRYGDCKGKANLLHALLAGAEIPSRIALVRLRHEASDEPEPFRLESGMNNFNHAILIVDLPSKPVVCDPTHPVPFGELPLEDQDSDLLPVTAPGSDIVRSPGSGPADNVTTSVLDLALSGDGVGASGTISLDMTGAEAPMLEWALRAVGEKKVGDLVQRWVGYDKNRLENVEFKGGKDGPLHVSARLSLSNLASHGGGLLTLRISDMRQRWVAVLPDEERLTPVVLGPRRTQRDTVRIALPDGVSVAQLPAAAHVEGPGIRYDLDWTKEDHALVARRTMVVDAASVPVSGYPQLRAATEQVHTAEARAAVLRMSP